MSYCDIPSQVRIFKFLTFNNNSTFCLFHNFSLTSISKYPEIFHFHFLKTFDLLIEKEKMMCFDNFAYLLIPGKEIFSLMRHVISWN